MQMCNDIIIRNACIRIKYNGGPAMKGVKHRKEFIIETAIELLKHHQDNSCPFHTYNKCMHCPITYIENTRWNCIEPNRTNEIKKWVAINAPDIALEVLL